MPSLLESVNDLLGEGDLRSALGRVMGADGDAAAQASEVAVPALIGGLASTAATDGGPAAVAAMLDDAGTAAVDDPAALLDGDDQTAGSGLLDTIFGEDRAELVSALASNASLDGSMITKALPALASIVVGAVAKRRADDSLDADGVASMLATEKEGLDDDGLLDTIGDFLGGGFGMATGAAAAVAGAGSVLGGKAKDAVGDIGDAAGDAADAVGDAVGDAAGAVADKAGDAVDAVGDAAGAVADKAGDAAGAVAAKLGGLKDSVGGVDDDRNGSLGWLWWALGAVVLVLLLAWVLSRCNDDGDTDVDASGTAAAVDDGGGDEDREGHADDEDGDEEGHSGDDDDTDGAAAADTDDDAADEEAMDDDDGAMADEDEADEDDEATSGTDDDDPADDADTDGDLQAALDAALAGTGVTGAVSGGDITLEGTLDSEDSRAALLATVTGLDGAGSIDDQMTVEEAEPETEDADSSDGDEDATPDAGDTINDLLDLDPVTFAVSSARITDAGQAVLDEAAAFLEANADVRVEIGGHTDNDGTIAENERLSQLRADSVKAYLESKGITGDRMETVGYGEAEPKVPNDSALAKSENRRIEFTIL